MDNVSVIVPVYNVEKYLARCLDSVISQSHRELEILCVNDGSTDGCASILETYAAKDSRVVVITQENCGLSGARNAGLDRVTGEWVMFLDSDDWIPSDAVEGFLRVAKESAAPVVASAQFENDVFSATGKREFKWQLRTPALQKLVGERKMQSSACNKFYRASLLKNRRFIDGIYFEDWPFVTELFGDIDSFAKIEEPMYVYCKNVGSESIVRSDFSIKKVESYLRGIEHVREYFKDHPMRKFAMKRIKVAQKMLEKRMRRAGYLRKRKFLFW